MTHIRHLLNSRIHRATVPHCELYHEGSCAVDESLARCLRHLRKRTGLHLKPRRRRALHHYAVRGERGGGAVSLNGSAARRASEGDLIVIVAGSPVGASREAVQLEQYRLMV